MSLLAAVKPLTRRSRLAIAACALGHAALGAQPSTVILVRHAEKATSPADDPGLSADGTQRAADLGAALAGARVTSVITTQLARTQLTAKPVSDALGSPPIVVPVASPVASHVDAVAAAVRARPPGDVVLVVGHSNTIPLILAALGGPKLPDLCDPEYAWLFILEFPGGGGAPRFIRATYGAPNPPDAAGCTRTMR